MEPGGTFFGTELNINNCGYGVLMNGKANIIYSKLANCEVGAYTNSQESILLNYNNFEQNASYALINNSNSAAPDAKDNYWASPNGPSVYNKDQKTWEGDGERILGLIDYVPWAVERL